MSNQFICPRKKIPRKVNWHSSVFLHHHSCQWMVSYCRRAASHGSAGYSHNQQMVSTASSPEGNSKTELVKSVTIHGGKCLTVPANANEAHVRSRTEQGWAGRNGVQFKNDSVWQSHSSRGQNFLFIYFLACGQTFTNECRLKMPVTFKPPLCPFPLRVTLNEFHQRPG